MQNVIFRKMKYAISLTALLVSLVFLLSATMVSAVEHPVLYFFWGEGCPHCEKAKGFLPKLQEKYPELEMRWFEVWHHGQFSTLADRMRQAYEIKASSVPMFFLDTWSMTGFQSDEMSGPQVEDQVVKCLRTGSCFDALGKLGPLQSAWRVRDDVSQGTPQGWEWFPATLKPRPADAMPQEESPRSESVGQPTAEAAEVETAPQKTVAASQEDESILDIPIFGTVDVKKIGLPLFTVVLGGLDGFNPCAMWVLCFLLSLVIYAKSRTKILVIGGIFVFASGLIYFLFMAAWLNLFIIVGYVKYLRITVALVAIVMGVINCKDFFFFKKGISLTIPESAHPKLGKRMRSIVNASAWPAMIFGTVFLAVTANLIELLCTAGFPAIYTRILTLNELSTAQYYLYLVLYNVVYVLPLAVIVTIFGWKMGSRRLSEKEGRILKLVGGALMLVLGLVLLFKPELLMF
ncbi:hypothetical protein CSB45_06090 [candidate division KSB3 bacterium]|uniref:Thioredoxin domain-containing protein n=1 Tax=candidate division KSB3 bacterium TaxID=2044937 RepID=A0A2G6E7D5_9BACT|nr:MAG: hypothetical protein CSB45_06090 [candidate division KSB3 bacterium]PIE30217.1 MAG: hypothetical protein CSA57_04805 [candidate division KSB3 bacterium]